MVSKGFAVTDARFFPPLRMLFFAWAIALAAILASPLAAQPDEARFGSENIAVELRADGMPQPGEEWTLALHFTPSAEEWHGYWSNPGDAGLGMQVQLDLPEGWEVSEHLYPVPERLLISGLMNHIYKGEFAVLVPVSVPEDAVIEGFPEITGFAEYLACTDLICVPQDAVLRARPGGDFARWRAELAPKLDAAARYAFEGEILRIGIPLPQSVALTDPHVFVENTQLVEYSGFRVFQRDGDTLIAEMRLDSEGEADQIRGILSFGDGNGVRFEANAGDVSQGGKALIFAGSPNAIPTPPLWTLLLGALVGGLILNIMPCVFPILSLKAISLARAGESEAQARSEGLAYTAGVVLACVALGALMLALRAAGEQVGWAFQLQEPGVVVALLFLAAVISANFAGVFELPSVAITRGGEPAGAFATGLLAAVAATPCTGPFMAAALGAALLLPAPIALLLFALLGLGLALPFLLIGFVPALRNLLPKPGAWMERFRKAMAIPMGLTALALIWLVSRLGGQGFALFALVTLAGVIGALMVVGRLQRAGKMAWPAFGLVAAPFLIFGAFALPSSYQAQSTDVAAESIHTPLQFSAENLAEARASGQPVFLWFTADWCVTCKVNESVAIEREAVLEAFEQAGVITMVGDWTQRDEAITTFLTEQGAAGVPLYLWYSTDGESEQLPQVLTPDMLIERTRTPAQPQ